MSDPFLGQLMLVGFNFAPTGWQIAAGQPLPISQNTALFSLLGTNYGGNGTSTFALPNLQGNVAVGYGQGSGLSSYYIGQTGGSSNVTLLPTETPIHTHTPSGKDARATPSQPPANSSFAESGSGNVYSTSTSPLTAMSPAAISTYGGNLQHNNLMPFLGMYWVIAMRGIFPARN